MAEVGDDLNETLDGDMVGLMEAEMRVGV